MNKKLIALAVVGATFAPAVMAQSANPVTLYGRIWVMANSLKADGSATPLATRTTIADGSSMIGFKGEEDLGGGLKAIFQLESGVVPDAGGGTWGSRNSGVGLKGAFGTIILGQWDGLMKQSVAFVDPFGQNTIGAQQTIIASASGEDFNRREKNMIQYWSNAVNGFSVRLMYGANEGKTATANPSSIAASVDYTMGPLRLNYAHQKHTDTRGATVTAGVVEKMNNLSASFTVGPVKFAALTQRGESTGWTKRTASEAAVTYTVGNNEFIGNVARYKNGAVTTAAVQPEAKLAAVGYNYNFTKRTTFMARYASIKNNSASNANLVDSNLNSASTAVLATANNDPKGFGMGFRHLF